MCGKKRWKPQRWSRAARGIGTNGNETVCVRGCGTATCARCGKPSMGNPTKPARGVRCALVRVVHAETWRKCTKRAEGTRCSGTKRRRQKKPNKVRHHVPNAWWRTQATSVNRARTNVVQTAGTTAMSRKRIQNVVVTRVQQANVQPRRYKRAAQRKRVQRWRKCNAGVWRAVWRKCYATAYNANVTRPVATKANVARARRRTTTNAVFNTGKNESKRNKRRRRTPR